MQPHPSVKTWIFALILLLIPGLGAYAIYAPCPQQVSPLARYANQQLDTLEEAQNQDPKPTVVALGNSLMTHAMEGELPETSFHTLRVSQRAANFLAMEPLLPRIRNLKPDVLLVQTELLLLHSYQGLQGLGSMTPIQEFRACTQFCAHSLGFPNLLPEEKAGKPVGMNLRCEATTAAKLRESIQQQRLFLEKEQKNPSPIEERLKTLSQSAQKVILVTFPRGRTTTQALQNLTSSWHQTLQEKAKPYPNIQFVTLGTSLSDAMYCDDRHLNDTGRTEMKKRLLNLLSQELQR